MSSLDLRVYLPICIFSFLCFLLITCSPQRPKSLATTVTECDCSCTSTGESGLDFSGQDLRDHNFTVYGSTELQFANFEGADLRGAQFQNMDLTGANFYQAILTPSAKGKTNFSGAHVTNACFVCAQADSSNLQGIKMQGTDFSCARLIRADFGPKLYINDGGDVRTRFRSTSLDIPNFPLAYFKTKPQYWSYTDFSYTDFNGLTKDNINFKGWDMKGAILRGVNLSGFDLTSCNLRKANFANAILNSVTLDSAYMYGINMDSAKLNLATLIHAYFNKDKDSTASMVEDRCCTYGNKNRKRYFQHGQSYF